MPKQNSLLDGTRTSPEWRKARPKLCVLPVGSFEQHSTHLPLATDNIQVEYFARFIARELGAALLPTLPYGTSLEHSGFPGTFTLRPETLMQIVRDIADAVERQGFTTMILLNGHGGNFALVPVVRDINRSDRKLKILLMTWYDFKDEEACWTRRRKASRISMRKKARPPSCSPCGPTSSSRAGRPGSRASRVSDSRTSPRSASASSRRTALTETLRSPRARKARSSSSASSETW